VAEKRKPERNSRDSTEAQSNLPSRREWTQLTNEHTVPNLSAAGCPEQVMPTLGGHLRGLSPLLFVRPPASSHANEPG